MFFSFFICCWQIEMFGCYQKSTIHKCQTDYWRENVYQTLGCTKTLKQSNEQKWKQHRRALQNTVWELNPGILNTSLVKWKCLFMRKRGQKWVRCWLVDGGMRFLLWFMWRRRLESKWSSANSKKRRCNVRPRSTQRHSEGASSLVCIQTPLSIPIWHFIVLYHFDVEG